MSAASRFASCATNGCRAPKRYSRNSPITCQEPASWLAGGKRILLDRVEWIVIPDSATAAAALQKGEVAWWELPIPDLIPMLRRNPNLTVAVSDPLGIAGRLVMNHLYPPFNDVRARRAILTALSQEDYMRAHVGDDDSMWKPMPGCFTPGTPLYTEEGGEILKGPRRLDAAKRLLADSGYGRFGGLVGCRRARGRSSCLVSSAAAIVDLLGRETAAVRMERE